MYVSKLSTISSLVGTLAIAISGCAMTDGGDDAPIIERQLDILDTLPRMQIGAVIMPVEDTVVYRSFARVRTDEGLGEITAGDTLEARLTSTAEGRRLEISGPPNSSGTVALTPQGRVAESAAEFAPGQDLIQYLPPSSREVQLGVSYESAPPPFAFVRSNHNRGNLTMTERVVNTPIGIWEVGESTLVRLDTRAYRDLAAIDYEGVVDEGSTVPVTTVTLGAYWAGIADIVHTPGQGWRVLRFTRYSNVDASVDLAKASLDEIRSVRHVEFTACAASSTALGSHLTTLRRAGTAEVSTFATCDRR